MRNKWKIRSSALRYIIRELKGCDREYVKQQGYWAFKADDEYLIYSQRTQNCLAVVRQPLTGSNKLIIRFRDKSIYRSIFIRPCNVAIKSSGLSRYRDTCKEKFIYYSFPWN